MIFQGYEEHILEGYFDLTSVAKDSKAIEDTIDDFFKISHLQKTPSSKKPWYSFFSNMNASHANNFTSYLTHEKVKHVLLILPESFLIHITDAIFATDKRKRRPQLKQDFTTKIVNRFESQGISCSIVWHGSSSNRNNANTEAMNAWLNLEYLSQQISLDTTHGYLVGLIDMKVSSKTHTNALSVIQDDRYFTLDENCSLLLGHDADLFRFTSNAIDGHIKITNVQEGDTERVDFITKNIDEISSQHQQLNEDYFQHDDFGEFDLTTSGLEAEDVIIYFNNAPIAISKTLRISNGDSKQPLKTHINLKNKYGVVLKKIGTPIKNNLAEIDYLLVKLGSQYIVVGGSRAPKGIYPLAKISVDVKAKTLRLTNLSNDALVFERKQGVVSHKVTKTLNVDQIMPIVSDTDNTEEEVITIKVNPEDHYLFTNSLHFEHASLLCEEKSIVVEYHDFTIGSFNTKLELHRDYLKHFQVGNIIDIDQTNKQKGGRLYKDGERDFLGQAISSKPLTLTVEEEKFTLKNTINSASPYSLILSSSEDDKRLFYGERIEVDEDTLFDTGNTIKVLNKDDVSVLEVSITAPSGIA